MAGVLQGEQNLSTVMAMREKLEYRSAKKV